MTQVWKKGKENYFTTEHDTILLGAVSAMAKIKIPDTKRVNN